MDTNDCIHEWQYGRDRDVCVECGSYAVFPARTDAQMRVIETAKREQQARRFAFDPDHCVSFESYIFGAVFPTPAAMSADAGSIGAPPESITHLREAWDRLDPMRQEAARQAIVELEWRMRHEPRTKFADAVIAVVLDA